VCFSGTLHTISTTAAVKIMSPSVSAAVLVLLLVVTASATTVKYPNEILPEGNTTVFSINYLAYGGQFIAALGKDRQLWSVYQKPDMSWSPWTAITSICPSANDTQRACLFDADPSIIRNRDGRLEIFVRFHTNLDLWNLHMTDAMDPLSWTLPREPSCVDQAQDTGIWWCLCPGHGPKRQCVYPQPAYWNTQPVFPTSDISLQLSPKDDRVQVFFRGFEGHLYMSQQATPGDSTLYLPPVTVAPNTLFV